VEPRKEEEEEEEEEEEGRSLSDCSEVSRSPEHE
jgi:hypothetical protein